MAGEASFTIDEDDFVSAIRATYWIAARKIFSIGLIGAYSLFLGWLVWRWQEARSTDALLYGFCSAAAMFAAILLFGHVRATLRAHATFASHKILHYPQTLRWDAQSFSLHSAVTQSTVPYTDLFRWAESRTSFLFYTSTNIVLIVPKRGLDAEQMIDLRATLVEHGPPRR